LPVLAVDFVFLMGTWGGLGRQRAQLAATGQVAKALMYTRLYRVLVASDAIGMGLNLNIRRVVFHGLSKFNGVATEALSAAHTKQIAGRAGRRSSIYPNGFATTLQEQDMPALHRALATPPESIATAGLFPNPEQLLAFSARLPLGTPLAEVIRRFLTASELSGPYFMCRGEEMIATAALLERYAATTTLEQRATLCLMPSNLRNADLRNFLFRFMDAFVAGAPVRLGMQLPLDSDPAFLTRELPSLEAKASALDMYLWLATKLGAAFVDVRAAADMRTQAMALLERALELVSESAKEASFIAEAVKRRAARAQARAAAAAAASAAAAAAQHGSAAARGARNSARL
jgi:ATP-dependent RNA helicase SUPV3L1/SUV3